MISRNSLNPLNSSTITMLKAKFSPYRLSFKTPAKTSRSVMEFKDTFFVEIFDSENPQRRGIGEAALFRGLSAEDVPEFEAELSNCCENFSSDKIEQIKFSSIRFGLETALSDLKNGGHMMPFNQSSNFSIPINGLVWMADARTMLSEMSRRIESGFNCVKLKIGGVDFDEELDILKSIRREYSPSDIEIRLDANGSFAPKDALIKLDRLAKYSIHSLEQPIKPGQYSEMAEICEKSPIPIALDEELIGMTPDSQKLFILSELKPSYIILKPSLCGGFVEADQWIAKAEALGMGWWATSALESNVGLNAIARWTLNHNTAMPQGLGTGSLYTNNITSPLAVLSGDLIYNSDAKWDLNPIHF